MKSNINLEKFQNIDTLRIFNKKIIVQHAFRIVFHKEISNNNLLYFCNMFINDHMNINELIDMFKKSKKFINMKCQIEDYKISCQELVL